VALAEGRTRGSSGIFSPFQRLLSHPSRYASPSLCIPAGGATVPRPCCPWRPTPSLCPRRPGRPRGRPDDAFATASPYLQGFCLSQEGYVRYSEGRSHFLREAPPEVRSGSGDRRRAGRRALEGEAAPRVCDGVSLPSFRAPSRRACAEGGTEEQSFFRGESSGGPLWGVCRAPTPRPRCHSSDWTLGSHLEMDAITQGKCRD